MTRRVFLAIALPEDIKTELSKSVAKLKRFSPKGVRFIPPENWHITLIFLGDQTESSIEKVLEVSRKEIQKLPPPEVFLNSIVYGPSEEVPRMVWANTDAETSKKVGEICAKLSQPLESGGIISKKESRNFNGHITLARIAEFISRSELPPITLPLRLNFKPATVTLFESRLKPSGAEYDAIRDFGFSADSG